MLAMQTIKALMTKHTLFIYDRVCRATWLAPLLILLPLLTSCSNDDDSGENPSANSLTVLVFHPYCTLQDALQQDYNEIITNVKTKNLGSEVQLLHLVSANTENYCLVETKVNESAVRHDTLRRYRFSELDYTTLDGLRHLLTDVKSVQRHNSLAMIIGSHGSGWLTYPEKDAKTQSGTKRKAFGSGERYNSKYVIYFQTLTEALQSLDTQLKFLTLDCCNSQNVENAYHLRHITRWVIASPTEILADGMPYNTDFHRLYLGDYTGFGQAFVNYYRKTGDEATLSVVDTQQMDDLVAVMRKINDRYYDANIAHLCEQAETREIQPLGGATARPDFVDFKDYVYHLCDDAELRNEFDAALSKAVVWKDATEYFYWDAYWRGGQIYKLDVYSGISDSEPISNYSKYMLETEWYKATHTSGN